MNGVLSKDIQTVLLSREQIEKRVEEIAEAITRDYRGESVLMVGILRGAVVFFSELVKRVDLDVRFDFMVVSSYGSGTESGGEIRIVKDLSHVQYASDVLFLTSHTNDESSSGREVISVTDIQRYTADAFIISSYYTLLQEVIPILKAEAS